MQVREGPDHMMLGIGLNYIRFAIEEPHLFRFLFQSGFAAANSLLEMIESAEPMPVIAALQADAELAFIRGDHFIARKNPAAFNQRAGPFWDGVRAS